MLGYTLDQVESHIRTWEALTHPEDLPQVMKVLGAHLAGETDSYEAEHRLRHLSGEWIWVLDKGRVIERDGQGKPLRVCGTHLDITARKRMEEEREKLEFQNRQLQKSESLGRMAGAIAHHFNNKLQAVMMSLDLAREGLPNNTAAGESLAVAMQSACQAAEVSSSMLTYLGQTQCKLGPLDLSKTCLKSLSLLRAAMPQTVALKTELPSPGPVVSADANQVHQLLTNLLTNAWEAGDTARNTIRLTLCTVSAADIPVAHRRPTEFQPGSAPYACLEVADTGRGIADQDIEKLFDPFFTTKFTGRGMGLSVVLGIVRTLHGAITVQSQPGQGSVFRVFLPLTEESIPLQWEPVIQAPKTIGSGMVLLVEDEAVVRKVVALGLKRLGYTVMEAADGVEAVALFRQYRADIRCVLTDLTMPHMDGWETMAAIRQLAPGLPVILASGYSEAQVFASNLPAVPQAFLRKPYELRKLGEVLARVMAE
jgi:PAS domain S-box-containing protein